MAKHCPVCSQEIIGAFGDEESDILLIGSIPDDEELKYHRMFTGQVSHIYKKELFHNAGIDLPSTRQVPLWFHDKSKNPDCLDVSVSLVAEEMKGKKFIILVGAEAVTYFTGLSIDNVNGLDVTDEVRMIFDTDSADSEEPDVFQLTEEMRFFAITSPKTVFRSLGEFRFGLQQLGKWLKENR